MYCFAPPSDRVKTLLASLLLFLAVLIQSPTQTVASGALEADLYCRVYRVVDGDTLRCTVLEKLDTQLRVGGDIRVRLADINAPELRPAPEPGAERALRVLEGLVFGKTIVLDVDDQGVFDKYGRVVAIVLVKWNDTHWLNVNRYLVEQGLASLWEHDNQWRLMETPLFTELGEPPEMVSKPAISTGSLLLLLASSVLVIVFVKGFLITLGRGRRSGLSRRRVKRV